MLTLYEIMITLFKEHHCILIYCKLLSALVRAFILFNDNGKKQR